MRRRPNQLLRNLLYASLIILAAMHPQAAGRRAQLAAGRLLAIVHGVADAAAAQPGPAVLAALAVYVAHQIHTHRPSTTRAHP